MRLEGHVREARAVRGRRRARFRGPRRPLPPPSRTPPITSRNVGRPVLRCTEADVLQLSTDLPAQILILRSPKKSSCPSHAPADWEAADPREKRRPAGEREEAGERGGRRRPRHGCGPKTEPGLEIGVSAEETFQKIYKYKRAKHIVQGWRFLLDRLQTEFTKRLSLELRKSAQIL